MRNGKKIVARLVAEVASIYGKIRSVMGLNSCANEIGRYEENAKRHAMSAGVELYFHHWLKMANIHMALKISQKIKPKQRFSFQMPGSNKKVSLDSLLFLF